ncbi:hypothetical protein D5S17_20090 [Pseudonocardiaceae bacterium YIM PH 21723]|nr:hypothetical protein D5S17_20090 [Pseudonocardiaceae bacterium YIM PH 21723]
MRSTIKAGIVTGAALAAMVAGSGAAMANPIDEATNLLGTTLSSPADGAAQAGNNIQGFADGAGQALHAASVGNPGAMLQLLLASLAIP